MSPSSLIFVAVIATWVIYLVLHVARRREQLATARYVDRFSSQMRILDRRAAEHEHLEAHVRVSSTRLGVDRPLAARPAASPSMSASTPSATGTRTAAARTHAAAAEQAVPSPDLVHSGQVRNTPLFAMVGRVARVSWHQVRVVALLGSLLGAIVTAVLAGLGLMAWSVPAVAVLSAVLVAAKMRSATLARQAARSRAAATRRREREQGAGAVARQEYAAPMSPSVSIQHTSSRSEAEAAGGVEGGAEGRAAVEGGVVFEGAAVFAPEPAMADPMPSAQTFVPARDDRELVGVGASTAALGESTRRAPARSASAVFDVAAFDEVPEPVVQADLLDGREGWAPTPVPPPTYTLKAKAYRAPVPPLVTDDVPVPIEDDTDDVIWDEQLCQPRVVGA